MAARFGEMLLERRRQLGLSIHQVATTIKIRPQIIEFFEQGNFSAMPPRGYAQGMISSYARYLGLNPRVVMDAYFDELDAYERDTAHAGGRLQDAAGFVSPRSMAVLGLRSDLLRRAMSPSLSPAMSPSAPRAARIVKERQRSLVRDRAVPMAGNVAMLRKAGTVLREGTRQRHGFAGAVTRSLAVLIKELAGTPGAGAPMDVGRLAPLCLRTPLEIVAPACRVKIGRRGADTMDGAEGLPAAAASPVVASIPGSPSAGLRSSSSCLS